LKRIKNSVLFYNRISIVYNLFLGWFFEAGRQRVASTLNEKKNLDILEIGSGTGSLVKFLEKHNSYLGIEGADSMYDISRLNYRNHSFKNIRYEDYHPGKKYNTVVLNYTLSVVDDPYHLMKYVRSCLTDDGKVYIVNHFSADNLFYKILQYISIHLGYNAYFPFDAKIFSEFFNITIFEPVNFIGSWKFIELTPKNNE